MITADRNAHIVESVSEQIISYVCCLKLPETTLPGGLLQRVDTSCLVMTHKESVDNSVDGGTTGFGFVSRSSDEVFVKIKGNVSNVVSITAMD